MNTETPNAVASIGELAGSEAAGAVSGDSQPQRYVSVEDLERLAKYFARWMYFEQARDLRRLIGERSIALNRNAESAGEPASMPAARSEADRLVGLLAEIDRRIDEARSQGRYAKEHGNSSARKRGYNVSRALGDLREWVERTNTEGEPLPNDEALRRGEEKL